MRVFQNAHADVQSELYKCIFGTDESKVRGGSDIYIYI